ncbi:MAG: hypothetical protein PHG73_08510, partial [Pygmaiobacter sp.]|nr:hypothetical protein [Pygmaiobacter sp.]
CLPPLQQESVCPSAYSFSYFVSLIIPLLLQIAKQFMTILPQRVLLAAKTPRHTGAGFHCH